ncbi:MAG: hypothetical protein EBU23_09865 [Mycobacteriaceae bacterium]|nr:hypothetical protein [Mycobacteriaceae bacterium]
MAKYHGKNGALMLGVTSGGAASSVANLSQWSVNIDQAVAEVTCLGDSFASFVAGMKNAKASMSGFRLALVSLSEYWKQLASSLE